MIQYTLYYIYDTLLYIILQLLHIGKRYICLGVMTLLNHWGATTSS